MSIDVTRLALVLAPLLFVGIVIMLEVGRRIGLRRAREGEPRLGFVRVDAVDRVLVELRTSMN